MAAFTSAALSMIGVPPVCGFITKWYLVIGAMERDSIAVLAVLLASSFLNAAYFVPIVYKAYFGRENPGEEHEHDDSHDNQNKEIPFIVVPLSLTAIVSVVLGLYPHFIVQLAESIVR